MPDASERQKIIERYSGRFPLAPLGYGTVRDYCDSCDYLPSLSSAQNDLKDLQRPWTVKAALGSLSVGSSLLEIGAGQPLVAALLADLGYDVTVIDPYDGSGGGPTEFARFVELYPNVRIIRGQFSPNLPEVRGEVFDGIYSVSVLEHIPEPELGKVFEGVRKYLKPRGSSFHSVDCVTHGENTAYHFEQCLRVAGYQYSLAGNPPIEGETMTKLFHQADADLETCYLSAAGHNLWRSGVPYDAFPFRKVLSFQTAVTASASPGSHPFPGGE